MTDEQGAAEEIYDNILVDLLQSEPPEEWLHKSRQEVIVEVMRIIIRHRY